MGRRAVLGVLASVGLAAACGSRTGLLLPGQSGPGGGGSGGSSSGGPAPFAVKCAAALLEGAPTPMQGYCPTRANQATGTAPRAPQVAWASTPFPITAPENFLPAEIVVDPTGRAYVAIDASPLNPAGAPNQVFAVDPDGTLAWTVPFAGAANDLTLASDGNLLVLGTAVGAPVDPACPGSDGGLQGSATCVGTVTALSSSGAVARQVTFIGPASSPYESIAAYDAMTLASDGSFFLEAAGTQYGALGGLAHASIAGDVLWQWPPFGADEGLDLVPPLVVGPSDDVVGADATSLVLVDATGNQLWQEDLDVQLSAVDGAGHVVALSTDTGSLLHLDVDGNTLLATPLAVTIGTPDAAELALAGDGTTIVLLANEASSPGLTKSAVQLLAVAASGATLWTTTLQVTLPYDPAALTTHYGLFVDGAGTAVVTAGSITGIDLATGSTLWTLPPPHPKSCLRPAVLGAGGALLATQCDGTVFLARDP